MDCKYYSGRPRIWEWQRGDKCKCQSCQQVKHDTENSIKVSREHVAGKFCKEWSQCNKCSQIKHIVKVLRHFSGCECKSRCPACQWPDKTKEGAQKKLIATLADLYGMMLPKARVIGWRVQKAIEERQKEEAK